MMGAGEDQLDATCIDIRKETKQPQVALRIISVEAHPFWRPANALRALSWRKGTGQENSTIRGPKEWGQSKIYRGSDRRGMTNQ